MVRGPCFDSNGMKKGAWSEEEDNKLRAFVLTHGHSNWRLLPKYAGLARCGKSCRLRWVNYLKPGVRRGNFTIQEEDLIIKLHAQFPKKWSIIATYFPGRTDNDIKNFWNAHIEKRRKRNPDHAKKVKWQTSEVPKEEKLSSASLIKHQEPCILPFDQLDLWPDHHHHHMFPGDAGCLPTLVEEGFFYDDQRYRELSCSGPSYMKHDTMFSEYVDQPVQGNLLSESSPLDHTSNFQNGSCCDIAPPLQEEGGGYHGHLFDYGMHFLS